MRHPSDRARAPRRALGGLALATVSLALAFGGATAQTAGSRAGAAAPGVAIPATEKLLDQQALKDKLAGRFLYPTKPSAADASMYEFFFKDGAWKLSSDRYAFDGNYTIPSNSYCVERPGNKLCFAVTSDQNNIYRLYGVKADNSYSPMFEIMLADDFHGMKAPSAAPATAPRP